VNAKAEPMTYCGSDSIAGLAGGLAFVIGKFLTFARRRIEAGTNGSSSIPRLSTRKSSPSGRKWRAPASSAGDATRNNRRHVPFRYDVRFLYRSVASAWPPSSWGPFHVLHQPLRVGAIAWIFWAVSAFAEAYTISFMLERW
jgi:hypothetical protein